MAAFSEQLLATAGARFAGPISILRNWTFCLFYVMAELWGSVVVSLLFWGFANQVCCHCWLHSLAVQLRAICIFLMTCCRPVLLADEGLLMQITTVDEAKTFYPLFGLGANVALIFSGRAVKYFSNVRPPATSF